MISDIERPELLARRRCGVVVRPRVPVPEVSVSKTFASHLLAAQQSATPGFMTLLPVSEDGRVVDFVWEFASAAAARLLGQDEGALRGRSLLELLGADTKLFDGYRAVVDGGAAVESSHVHAIGGREDVFRHAARRFGDGVAVTLTNLSAVRRWRALMLELHLTRTAMLGRSA